MQNTWRILRVFESPPKIYEKTCNTGFTDGLHFFDLIFGGEQAVQAIFSLGFIPTEEDFREFSNEEYMHLHEKELDICGKMYTFKSERLTQDKELYAFSEEEKDMMLKGAEILNNLCKGHTFISDEVKLQYAAQQLPDVFTKGTKYEREHNKK